MILKAISYARQIYAHLWVRVCVDFFFFYSLLHSFRLAYAFSLYFTHSLTLKWMNSNRLHQLEHYFCCWCCCHFHLLNVVMRVSLTGITIVLIESLVSIRLLSVQHRCCEQKRRIYNICRFIYVVCSHIVFCPSCPNVWNLVKPILYIFSIFCLFGFFVVDTHFSITKENSIGVSFAISV